MKIFNPTADYDTATKLPKERAVRCIINTSVNDGKMSLSNCHDIQVLEESLKRESARDEPRKGILQPLRSKLAKLKKAAGELPVTIDNAPQITQPDPWERAKQYFSAAKHFARASVACQVMLGFELTAIKKKLGYTQGRKKSGKRKTENVSVFQTWEEHCKAELGITDRTARNYINLAEAAKRRLKSCFKNLPLLDQPVTEYNYQQLELLDKAVRKITDGQTQSDFLLECGVVKAPQGSAAKGGDLTTTDGSGEGAPEDTEPTMQQLAFILFSEPVQQLGSLRSSSNYEAALHSLPLAGSTPEDISLTTIERDLETMLNDVRAAKEAHLKNQQLPA